MTKKELLVTHTDIEILFISDAEFEKWTENVLLTHSTE
jgi:hypothetical protein